ncbi:hypothetical protein T484DRAFT_1812062 [Baffinella frigidus]|nr:hypothetical protein T484DRAFT_1812062 [Cryptophyta sp. CCMP2293]
MGTPPTHPSSPAGTDGWASDPDEDWAHDWENGFFSRDQYAMVRRSETQADDDFEVTTRSVGCAAALLPRAKSITTWWSNTAKKEKTISTSEAAGNSSRAPRAYLEIESSSTGKTVDAVRTPTLTAEEAWQVMRKRFQVAHSTPSSPTSCERVASDAQAPMRACSDPTRRELDTLMVLSSGGSSEWK